MPQIEQYIAILYYYPHCLQRHSGAKAVQETQGKINSNSRKQEAEETEDGTRRELGQWKWRAPIWIW